MTYRALIRATSAIVIAVVIGVFYDNRAYAQDSLPPDVTKAIDDLGTKLNDLAKDKTKFDAAIRSLDTKINAIRNKSDPTYVNAIITDLNQWIAGLSDGQKADARTRLSTLIASIDQLRDPNSFESAKRLLAAVVNVLKAGKFSQNELAALAQDPSIKEIGAELDKLLKEQKPGIHIISATYGNHRTGQTCNALAYFRGRCEGKTNCPDDNATVDGTTVCGYEPAPLASPSSNAARVVYECLSFRLRPLDPPRCTQATCPKPVELRGKGQIICAPRT